MDEEALDIKRRMSTEQIVKAMIGSISRAVDAAVIKHGGRLPKTLERASLMCAEEAGELAAAVLDAGRDTQITRAEYDALESRIIAENMDLIAAAIIFVMVNSGCVPVNTDEIEGPSFEVDPNMKVM